MADPKIKRNPHLTPTKLHIILNSLFIGELQNEF